MNKNLVLAMLFLLSTFCVKGQDTFYLKVHFLYGSKPKWAHRKTEDKWFGGKLGGHVGVEIDTNCILNFVPNGRLHLIAHKNKRNSRFTTHNHTNFYEIMGGTSDSNKKLIIYIPISHKQKQRFDSLKNAYLSKTPYDYAFVGMRCGAAAYDILSQLDVLPELSHSRLIFKIFYPKKLRKKLLQMAISKKWHIYRVEGAATRKWEED